MSSIAPFDSITHALRTPRNQRRLPIGAEIDKPSGGVHFRLWAPRCNRVTLFFDECDLPPAELEREEDGHFSLLVPNARQGGLYHFEVDGASGRYPDPVSRYQPAGVHGSSQIIDPDTFGWTDSSWKGVAAEGQVLYEMHIGTLTKEGTWAAATLRLSELKDLGITCLEVMPVNEFAGRWGWGYDGVQLFAPFHHYGSPDDMRLFINQAHELGIGVILDLVYNHLGPDGNYTGVFSNQYVSPTHRTDWGDALNFDGPGSEGVREFFLSNIRMWIEEYHLDGFRFDATQAIVDNSAKHILAEITETAWRSAKGRKVYLINENEPQNTQLVRPTDSGGYGMNALWNDDFHHSALVAISGHNEAYYSDYKGSPQELISTAKWGYLYQGQRYKWHKRRRGTAALDLPATAFVHFLQNHDQIANSGRGFRAHQITSPGELKAITAFMLLMPQTPMLFQGQEFAASSTFHYFSDHNVELAELIRQGRAKEIAQFPSAATESIQKCLHDPAAEATFLRSKIDWSERTKLGHVEIYQLHQDLLRLRREEPLFRRVGRRGDIDGAVLGPSALVIRYFDQGNSDDSGSSSGDDRLLIVNLGQDIALDPAPEPLLGTCKGRGWEMMFTTEDPKYGGAGTAPLETELEGWHIPGRTAVLLRPLGDQKAPVATRHRVQGSAQEARKRE